MQKAAIRRASARYGAWLLVLVGGLTVADAALAQAAGTQAARAAEAEWPAADAGRNPVLAIVRQIAEETAAAAAAATSAATAAAAARSPSNPRSSPTGEELPATTLPRIRLPQAGPGMDASPMLR